MDAAVGVILLLSRSRKFDGGREVCHVARCGGGHVASREDYNMGMSEVVARRRVIVRTPERISKVQAMRRIRCLVH